MKMLIPSAVAIAIATAAIPAGAATFTGVIAKINMAEQRIQFEDGQWFALSTGHQASEFDVGDRVKIEQEIFQNGFPVARDIEITEEAANDGDAMKNNRVGTERMNRDRTDNERKYQSDGRTNNYQNDTRTKNPATR